MKGRSAVQLHLWSIGRSQKGKSHLIYSVLLAIPDDWFIKPLTSATAKSLLYVVLRYGEDYLKEKIIFFDEVESSKETIPLLRTLTSQTKIKPRHLSIDTQAPGADRVLDLQINGKRVVWFTNVNLLPDNQLQKRFIIGNVDESLAQDARIFKLQDQLYRQGHEARAPISA